MHYNLYAEKKGRNENIRIKQVMFLCFTHKKAQMQVRRINLHTLMCRNLITITLKYDKSPYKIKRNPPWCFISHIYILIRVKSVNDVFLL